VASAFSPKPTVLSGVSFVAVAPAVQSLIAGKRFSPSQTYCRRDFPAASLSHLKSLSPNS
jgi:hypothetical protein